MSISRREYISIENKNRYNQFPVGDKQGKCECPTDNKQAHLFILWIYKSYGLFFQLLIGINYELQ